MILISHAGQGPDIFSFPIFSAEFCDRLLLQLQQFEIQQEEQQKEKEKENQNNNSSSISFPFLCKMAQRYSHVFFNRFYPWYFFAFYNIKY